MYIYPYSEDTTPAVLSPIWPSLLLASTFHLFLCPPGEATVNCGHN